MQQRSKRPELKSKWKNQLDESDPAYMWAQCMAPTYGINILGTRAGLSFPYPLYPDTNKIMRDIPWDMIFRHGKIHGRCRDSTTKSWSRMLMTMAEGLSKSQL